MFHRLPSFSIAAATAAALIFLLVLLFASSHSSPGTALADHNGRVHLAIESVMPEVGEEGRWMTVTLKLDRPLKETEKYCYHDTEGTADERRKDQVCIEGGVKVRDNYNDHLNEEGKNPYDNYIKFVFYGSQVEDRITFSITDDECITPNRQLQIWIATEYQDRDDFPDETKYGYDIDTTDHHRQSHRQR